MFETLFWVLLESQEVKRVWCFSMTSFPRRWGPEVTIRRVTSKFTLAANFFLSSDSGVVGKEYEKGAFGQRNEIEGQRRPLGNSCFCFKTQLTWLPPTPSPCPTMGVLSLLICTLRTEAASSRYPQLPSQPRFQ